MSITSAQMAELLLGISGQAWAGSIERCRRSRSWLCSVWFVSARGAKRGVSEPPVALPRMAGGHGDFDAADGDADQGADLEELEADRAAGGVGQPGRLEADAAHGLEQHIGHRGEPQAKLIGAHGGRRGAVCEEIELAFLDAVLQ